MEKGLIGAALGYVLGLLIEFSHPIDAIMDFAPGGEPTPIETAGNMALLGGIFPDYVIVPVMIIMYLMFPFLWVLEFFNFGP